MQDTRVVARRGARELTPYELNAVQRGAATIFLTGGTHLDLKNDF